MGVCGGYSFAPSVTVEAAFALGETAVQGDLVEAICISDLGLEVDMRQEGIVSSQTDCISSDTHESSNWSVFEGEVLASILLG